MIAHSHVLAPLPLGVVLDVVIEELRFNAYIVISEPDIALVAQFVPRERFDSEGDVHVAAVAHHSQAREQVEELVFNMNIGDTAVFLCADQPAYAAALEELGQGGQRH